MSLHGSRYDKPYSAGADAMLSGLVAEYRRADHLDGLREAIGYSERVDRGDIFLGPETPIWATGGSATSRPAPVRRFATHPAEVVVISREEFDRRAEMAAIELERWEVHFARLRAEEA